MTRWRTLVTGSAGILLLIITLFPGCAERERINPFDPGGKTQPLVTLELTPLSHAVRLEWELTQEIEGIQGFRLYRAVDSPENFVPLADFSPHQFSYTDTTVATGRWYFYRMTALGMGEESAPSSPRKVLLGPGTIWVLSNFNAFIKQVSYDLLHVQRTFHISFPPRSWSIVPGDSIIWVSYVEISRGISRISKNTGREERVLPGRFTFPQAVAHDPRTGRVFVLDMELEGDNPRIVTVQNRQVIREMFLSPPDRYFRMAYHPADQTLIVLGEQHCLIQPVGEIQTNPVTITFPDGFIGQGFALGQNGMYLLTALEEEAISRVFRVTSGGTVEDSLLLNGFYYAIARDEATDMLYLAEFRERANDLLVQLSSDGQRHWEAPDFIEILDIGINPVDHSVTVVDRFTDVLRTYDLNGRLITESIRLDGRVTLSHPSRVFIE